MIISKHEQGTEEWEAERKGRATASRFGEILTPATLKLSKSSRSYAIQLAAERQGVESPPRLPSLEMETGTEREPLARQEYAELNSVEVVEAGFCMMNATDKFGMSPDGLIGDDGLIEIKCPNAETLIGYHLDQKLPSAYRSQIQGQLWISGREWCDLFAWHPQIEPFQIRVFPDFNWQHSMKTAMPDFLESVEKITKLINFREVFGFDFSGVHYE